MLWYFAHPYSAPTLDEQKENFERCCIRTNALLDEGLIVFSPVCHSHPMESRNEDLTIDWLEFDRSFLERCDGLILAPGWEESKGCQREYEEFLRTGKPIFEFSKFIRTDPVDNKDSFNILAKAYPLQARSAKEDYVRAEIVLWSEDGSHCWTIAWLREKKSSQLRWEFVDKRPFNHRVDPENFFKIAKEALAYFEDKS